MWTVEINNSFLQPNILKIAALQIFEDLNSYGHIFGILLIYSTRYIIKFPINRKKSCVASCDSVRISMKINFSKNLITTSLHC